MLCNTQTTGYVVIEVVRITRCPILRGSPLLDTNTGLNFLFIVEVPPLGKCRPGRPGPCCYATG